MLKNCEYCDIEFETKPSYLQARFCSRSCANKARKKHSVLMKKKDIKPPFRIGLAEPALWQTW